jgi:hypothetical protein
MTLSSQNDSNLNPLGPRAFDRLRAENEAAWLSRVFVPPPEFEELAGASSIILYGDSGSGKTALRQALTQRLCADNMPTSLVANWRPALPHSPQSGTPAIQEWFRQAFDVCALALLEHIGRWPAALVQTKPYAKNTIVWFVHQYLQGDVQTCISRLEADCTPDGLVVLRELFGQTQPSPVLHADAAASRVIDTLVDAVRQMQLDGIWVFIDDLEPWLETDPLHLTQLLKDLLSTLALFENHGFTLKILAPLDLKDALSAANGFNRRRIASHELIWSAPQLQAICEARLAGALGLTEFQLDQLCSAVNLTDWLPRFGGPSPRGWLEMLRAPFLTYAALNPPRPLSQAEWEAVQQRHIPALHLDLETGKVYLGNGEIPPLSPASYNLLRYLYQTRHRACTRSELYFIAHRHFDHEPKSPQDDLWEHSDDWGRIIDTNLWRLRKKIEPDPNNPIYVVSETVKGVNSVVLRHAW